MGATGISQSLIKRSWDAASAARGVAKVVVATDDERIASACTDFGAQVVMTSPDCANGTERCAQAHAALGGDFDLIVNFQGDAPLTPPWFVEDLIAGISADMDASVATPVLRCDNAALSGFLEDRQNGRVGGTTAVFDAKRRALYFSKEVVPYTGQARFDDSSVPVFHHVGIYAYRPKVLAQYPTWPTGPLEQLEGLEQLRFLEQGLPVLCVQVDAKDRQFWELNNPEDVPRLQSMMADMGMA